jgi:hypothetical protein
MGKFMQIRMKRSFEDGTLVSLPKELWTDHILPSLAEWPLTRRCLQMTSLRYYKFCQAFERKNNASAVPRDKPDLYRQAAFEGCLSAIPKAGLNLSFGLRYEIAHLAINRGHLQIFESIAGNDDSVRAMVFDNVSIPKVLEAGHAHLLPLLFANRGEDFHVASTLIVFLC